MTRHRHPRREPRQEVHHRPSATRATRMFREAMMRRARNVWRQGPRPGERPARRRGRQVRGVLGAADVNFEIKRGEVVGIIGRNGAGKSTLLKILSRITEPTEGRVEISGRVASLLEVGTGFHPELTGRENIFLNGAILGMTRARCGERFDEIVDFSGVEKFIDTPVKRYSVGMYVRLAFAVAAHLEPRSWCRRGAGGRRRRVPEAMPRPHVGGGEQRPHRPVRQPQSRRRHGADQARHRLPVRPAHLRRPGRVGLSRTIPRRSPGRRAPRLGPRPAGDPDHRRAARRARACRPSTSCPERRCACMSCSRRGHARHVARGRAAQRIQSAGRLLLIQHLQPGAVAGRGGPLRVHADASTPITWRRASTSSTSRRP